MRGGYLLRYHYQAVIDDVCEVGAGILSLSG